MLIADILSGLLQWSIFQLRRRTKAKLFLSLFSIVLLLVLLLMFGLKQFIIPYMTTLYILMLFVAILWMVIILKRDLLHAVDWQKTVAFGENKLYNLLIVKLVSGHFASYKRPSWIPTNECKQSKVLKHNVNDLVDHFYKTQLWNRKGILINILINSIALNVFLSMNGSKISLFFALMIPLLLIISTFQEQFKDIISHPVIKTVPVSASLMSGRFMKHTILWVYLVVLPHWIIVLMQDGAHLIFLVIFQVLFIWLVYRQIIFQAGRSIFQPNSKVSKVWLLVTLILLIVFDVIWLFCLLIQD